MQTPEDLKENLDKKFDEQSAKKIFDIYHSDKGSEYALSADDLTRFLFDLLEQNGRLPIVPEAALVNVLKTLVLNYDTTKRSVTYIEWKSFFVYLQNSPLKTLLDKACEPYGDKLTKCRYFQLTRKDRRITPDVNELREVIQEGTDPIYIALDFADYTVFVAQPGVDEEEKAELSCLKAEAVDSQYTVTPISLPHFPPTIMRGVGENKKTLMKVSKKVAGLYVSGKTATTKRLNDLDSWDQKNLKVKETVSTGVKTGWAAMTSLWNASGLGPTISSAAEKVNTQLEESGVKAKFRDGIETASTQTKNLKTKLLSNEYVAKVHDATMQGVQNTVDFTKHTKREINQQMASSPASQEQEQVPAEGPAA